MSGIWFTADTHFGHRTAATMRGHPSVVAHDQAVADSLAAALSNRSVLWVLGDAAMPLAGLEHIAALPGRKRLVMGNHDAHPTADYLRVFESVHGAVRYKKMILTHIPVHPQELYRFRANVHGHIHKDMTTKSIGMPYVNVNWDFWRGPVSLDAVRAMVDEFWASATARAEAVANVGINARQALSSHLFEGAS